MLNRHGDNIQPCRTPRFVVISSDVSCTDLLLSQFSKILENIFHNMLIFIEEKNIPYQSQYVIRKYVNVTRNKVQGI